MLYVLLNTLKRNHLPAIFEKRFIRPLIVQTLTIISNDITSVVPTLRQYLQHWLRQDFQFSGDSTRKYPIITLRGPRS